MASEYGSLANIQKRRQDWEGARQLLTKSRDLFAKIGLEHMTAATQRQIDDLPAESKGAAQ
jgi:hypothetical protein